MTEYSPARVEFDIDVTPLYEDEDRTMALVEIYGENFLTINHHSTTRYDVLWGQGEVTIDGVVTKLSEGNSFVAPRGHAYRDSGRMLMFATTTPPFDPTKVEVMTFRHPAS